MILSDILQKSYQDEPLSKKEIMQMLELPPLSLETYQVMGEATRISKEVTGNQAEIHAQFSLNLAPCPCNCKFCSFAKINNLFQQSIELGYSEALSIVKQFEKEGANAIYIMTTAHYPISKFIEIVKEIKKNIHPDTVLIGNVGDKSLKEAERLKQAGLTGVYHALRLREGTDTDILPEQRRESILNFQTAGLKVGTCVEPVGPEHTSEELADMILYVASLNPAFSGAARRIALPGTKLSKRGMISELRMAQIVAITRLATPRTVLGNCTHEPCVIGAIAGANLFWAERGANPRDVEEKTEENRGFTIKKCQTLFHEAECSVLMSKSQFFC